MSNGPVFWYQYVPGLITWILITLPAYRFFSKTSGFSLAKRALVVIISGVVLGAFKNILAWFVLFVSGVAMERYTASLNSLKLFFSQVGFFYYMESIIIAWVLFIIFYMLELYQNFKAKSLEASELESQLARAQLESLRMQLQPHFLFNAHNTVSMLIRTKQYAQATEMISKISDLLRQSLKSQEGQFVTLGKELTIIKDYLEIEEIRFEDHLKVTFEIDSEIEEYLIPHLILQPIIENAFKHGISNSLDQAKLNISGNKTENSLLLTIHNSGPGLPEGWRLENQVGIGLTNTVQRLQRLYSKGSFNFNIFNEDDGVTVQIELPLRSETIE